MENLSGHLDIIQGAHSDRCEEFGHTVDSWSETDWMCALAGECGELANLIKKRRRGEEINLKECADEMADILAYLSLLASKMGIMLADAHTEKFNEVSTKMNADIKL